jgi:hypothetical protein
MSLSSTPRPFRPGFLPASLIAALALVLSPHPGAGQDPAKGPPLLILEHPASVRALALGGIPAWADRDPDLFLVNPGFLSRARGIALSRVRYAPETATGAMTAATPWWRGGVGVALRTGEEVLGAEKTTETALTAGYGRTVAGIGVGASLTGVSLDREGARDHGVLLDLGVAFAPGPVGVGLALGGLGWAPEPRIPPDPLSNPAGDAGTGGLAPTGLPWFRFGMGSAPLPLGPLDLSGSLGITARDGRRPEAGGGVEVSWWPVMGRTFTARAGLRGSPPDGGSRWSYGGAFLGDAFTLEYAARGRGDGGWTHGVALRFR